MQKIAQPTKVLRARAYVRVSYIGKDRQETLLSDAVQLDEARRYAEYQGFSFDEEASRLNADLDVSGFRKRWKQRPGLMRHYEAAKRGEFDCLVFFKISRLARNVREALDLIDAFEKIGISFHFVAERIDSSSAQGRFLRNVLLASAEMQSEDASAFLKSTWERRARDGKVHGTPPCWVRQTGPALYELIPDQVEAIRRLVQLRLEGLGYVKIAQRLNIEGYRTVRGAAWTGGTTFKYLQSTWIDTMLGVSFYGRSSEQPVEVPNAFSPILTVEEAARLRAVQELYSKDFARKPVRGLDWMVNRRRKNGRYSASSVHLLSGILFCSRCGSRLVPHQRGDTDSLTSLFRYHCPRAISSSELHPKGYSVINAHSVEDAVLRVVRSVLVHPPAPLQNVVQARKKSEDELMRLQARIDRLVAMHLDGKIQPDDYTRLYTELVGQKEALLALEAADPRPEYLHQALELGAKDELTRAELRQLVHLVVERVETPITIEGVTIRSDRKTLRRLAKITLRFPAADGDAEYLSALYEPRYAGYRRHIAVRPGSDYSLLIAERPRSRTSR